MEEFVMPHYHIPFLPSLSWTQLPFGLPCWHAPNSIGRPSVWEHGLFGSGWVAWMQYLWIDITIDPKVILKRQRWRRSWGGEGDAHTPYNDSMSKVLSKLFNTNLLYLTARVVQLSRPSLAQVRARLCKTAVTSQVHALTLWSRM